MSTEVARAPRRRSNFILSTFTIGIASIAIMALVVPEYSFLSAYAYKPTAIIQIYPTLSWYYAGEPITISGRVISDDTSQTLVLQVYNPRGNLYHAAPVSVANDGKFSTQFIIGGIEGIDGTYRAVVTYDHSQSATAFTSKHSDAMAVGNVNNLKILSGSNQVVQAGQILTLSGTTIIDGTLTIMPTAKVINHSVISGNGGAIVNYGTFRNANTVNLGGCSVDLTSTSLLINSGKMVISQADTCNASLTNSGIFNNQGTLEVHSGASQKATIVNNKTINNLQYATFDVYGTVQNNGRINNIGELTSGDGSQYSSILNSGSITNYCGAIYQSSTNISGNGPISACTT